MAYTIIKSDGSVLTDILDNSIDKKSSSLTLVGKSTQNYGLEFNQNFIKLLENFANTTAPKSPIKGQIWYDTSEEKIKIYNGSIFREPNRPQVSTVQPELTSGDIWIDSLRRQLYFNDGQGTILAGPSYTAQQGISGHEIVDIKDTNNAIKTIIKFKIGNVLLGVFSKEAFTPNYASDPPSGLLKKEGMRDDADISKSNGVTLIKGFTPAFAKTGEDIKFYITAKNAENLLDPDGNIISVNNFVQKNRVNFLTQTMNIANNIPLTLGASNNVTVQFDGPNSIVKNQRINDNFIIQVTDISTTNNAIFIEASNSRVGIYESNPLATLDINGNINIRGDLVSNYNSIGIFNTGVSTINIGGAASNIGIGYTTGTTTIKSNLVAQKNIEANGGSITSSKTSFDLLNTTVTTINLGGAATNINIGSDNANTNALTTFKNNVSIQNKLDVNGEIQIDDILLKDNVVKSTGLLSQADLKLNSTNGRIEFVVDAQATENLILKKRLQFDVAGEATLTNINQSGEYFKFLPVNVKYLDIGNSATLLNIGSSIGKTNILNELNVIGKIFVGSDQSVASVIDSKAPSAYLHDTNATTIYFGGNATSITTGANRAGTFTIRNNSTIVEGDLTVKGGDLRTDSATSSLFNEITTTISIGKSAFNIEIGNNSGNTRFNHPIVVNGNISINGRGINNKGSIDVGQTTSEFDLFPSYLSTLTVAKTAELIYIGRPQNITLNEIGGTVVIQYDLKIVNDLIITNIDNNASTLGGAGLLLKNINNRIVASDLVRTFGSSRPLGVNGDIWYSGNLTGPDGTAVIDIAKITKNLIISGGSISSTNTNVSIFDSVVTTLNVGGTGSETINLGSSTSKIKILGNLFPKWKSINQNYIAESGDRILFDPASNNIQITLPSTPIIGDEIYFIDRTGVGTYQLIINRNGNLINAAPNDLLISTPGRAFALVFTGSTRGWVYINA
jgi:hypothetical protein